MKQLTTLDASEMRQLYQRLAPWYDTTLWVYYLVGFRVMHYRRLAVKGLGLQRGACVVDLGCGTGLNFPLLEKAVGPEGRIIGVDLSADMLQQARQRVRRAGWENVELIEADCAAYRFPAGGVDGVLSTLALVIVDEYDDVIRRAAATLQPGGRLALFGMKRPEDWPEWLVRLGAWVQQPFGVRLSYANRRPWKALRRHLQEVSYEERYFGAAYISVGEAR